MRREGVVLCAALIAANTITGCGSLVPTEPKGYRAAIGEVVALTGKILVDGSGPDGVMVSAFNEKHLDQYRVQKVTRGLEHNGFVRTDGSFAFTTYGHADGLPIGNYVLLFRKDNTAADSKTESFNAAYGDPENCKFKVTLEAGKPIDMGKIELTTNL